MKGKRQFASRWFRFYEEVVDDPKVQTLGDKLGFFWMNCMCLASRNGGYLPPISDIAWKLRKTEAAISSMVAALHERGLLDQEADTFSPHNWNARQFCSDVSTERVRRFREKTKRPGNADETPVKRDETVSETAPDADTDTEQNRADTEAEKQQPVAAISSSEFPELTAMIQSRFPSTDGMFILRIAQDSIQRALSKGIDPSLVNDQSLTAAAVESLRTDRVKSAGLLLRTIPQIIETWGKSA